MDYRLATEDDAHRLSELRWEHKDSETPFDPAGKDDFILFCSNHLKKALKNELFCWVAVDNGLIVSTLYISAVRKIPKPDKPNGFWGYVTGVYTIPHLRGKGIGGALMEEAIEWSKIHGFEELIVWPSERAIPFYARAGFSEENDVMELLF